MKIRSILPLFLSALLAACASAPPAASPAPTDSPAPAASPAPTAQASPQAQPSPEPAASAAPQAEPAPSPDAAASPKPTPPPKAFKPFVKQLQVTYSDGVVSGVNSYVYDGLGRLVSDTERNGSDVTVGQRTWTYKDDGSIEIATFDGNRKIKTKTRQTWSGGLLMREDILNDKEEVQTSSEYRYNANGQKVSWVIQGKTTPQTASEYTWTGDRLTQVTVFDAARAIIKSYKRSYSAAGNIASEDEFDGKGALIRRTVYTWNGDLLAREEVRTAQDAVQKATTYSYDQRGLLVKTELYNRKGDLIEIQNRAWTDLEITLPNK
jgi:antitoxin component YwqK of YwqJK toxin-antitoxin module